ncbi:MAG: endonuclease/exonuclease/phosphatase family protein [Gammaproteobacteria bacterium]|nr:endonuclease/exonuclease/phosphatase family protein [Gammaproteobacteria bacterium]
MLTVVNWNLEWATLRSMRAPEILSRIGHREPEIVCLTEAYVGFVSGGHAISSRSDYGYPIKAGRRKVLLWSRQPWEEIDDLGDESMPPGRFVSGTTLTSLGKVNVIAVCIPWSGSRTGARFDNKRRRWQDHEDYLAGLAGILKNAPKQRLVLMGDFNQRIGGARPTGQRLRSALQQAIPPHLTLATPALGLAGRRTIDHVAISSDLVVEALGVVSNTHGERKLSDHFGVVASLSGSPA